MSNSSNQQRIRCRQLSRRPTESETRGLAEVHKVAYSADHLTSFFSLPMLGDYNASLVAAGELSVVAVAAGNDETEDDSIIGLIIAGTRVSAGVSSFLGRHRWYVLSVLLRHPRFIWERAIGWLQARRSPSTSSVARFGLLSIAVRPDVQSQGAGTAMLEFFDEQLKDMGVDDYGLSVRNSNGRAIAFYRRRGFEEERHTSTRTYFARRLDA